MKYLLHIITILFFLTNCSDAVKPADNTKATNTISLKSKPTQIELPDGHFLCVYEMDDKYLSDTTTEKQKEAWRQQLIKKIAENGISNIYDIFHKDGGGPQGGQWNTNANLLCALVIKDTNSLSHNYSVLLNNTKFKTQIKEHFFTNGIIAYFTLPSKDWEKNLKRVTKNDKDFKDVYDDVNQFLKVSLQIKDGKTYNGIIKIAYGE